jgi:hypothetical protein
MIDSILATNSHSHQTLQYYSSYTRPGNHYLRYKTYHRGMHTPFIHC